ncbi:MAG TPA: hypothetical protein VJ717_17610 [Gemmatimonadaceae bacterium]|nr:hypothetical protein [Gemmatimonadaceae bacterium]
MRFRTITALLITTAALAACSDSATAPSPSVETELDEVIFDISAEPNDVAAAQDRRDRPTTAATPPRERRLTEAQRQCIKDAVEEFRTANAAVLEQLQAIHKKAREAVAAGATRAEVRRILEQAKPLLERLRAAHEALHQKIRACLA